MSNRLVDLGYAAGWRVVRALPEPAAMAVARRAADTAWRRNGKGVQQLARNLRRVVGKDPDPFLVRDALRSYGRYWIEAFRLPSWSTGQMLDRFQMDGSELLGEPVGRGQGVIVALPHMANWDHAGAWVAAQGWRLTTVAERLRPESLYERFLAYRRSLGMEILPLTGAQPPLDMLADRVRGGAVVPLLADRDLSTRGVPVSFYGEPTRMPAGPAVLAIRTGAPLLVASLWYEPDRTRCLLRPAEVATTGNQADRVAATTQRIADMMAEGIAEHPVDWHMLQRLWLSDLPNAAPRAVSPAET